MPKIELSQRLLLFIEFIPIFFMSLTIHEYAHAFVAFKKGDNTAKDRGRLTLNPIKHIDPLGSLLIPFLAYFTGAMLIGWAKPVPVNRANLKRPKTDDILVSIAGPVSNLLLALLLFAFVYILRNELMFSGILVNILWMGVYFNIFLFFFNLLPVPPLDGSYLILTIFPGSLYSKMLTLPWIGMLFLYLLIFSPLWKYFMYMVEFVINILFSLLK